MTIDTPAIQVPVPAAAPSASGEHRQHFTGSPLDAAVALYDRADARTRWHVRIRRMLSCLERIEPLVPRIGRVLDLGCGHGIFSHFLALAAPGRRVLGVDLDPRKIAFAAENPGPTGRVSFQAGDALHPPAGPFDTVVIVDVLYLLGPAAQADVLAAARRILRPGGTLVCKAQESHPEWKHLICLGQEWLARRLGLTSGVSLTFLPRREIGRRISAAGFANVQATTVPRRIYPDVIFTARAE